MTEVRLPDKIAEEDDLIITVKILETDPHDGYLLLGLLPLTMNKEDTYRHLLNYMSSSIVKIGDVYADETLLLDEPLINREEWPIYVSQRNNCEEIN